MSKTKQTALVSFIRPKGHPEPPCPASDSIFIYYIILHTFIMCTYVHNIHGIHRYV